MRYSYDFPLDHLQQNIQVFFDYILAFAPYLAGGAFLFLGSLVYALIGRLFGFYHPGVMGGFLWLPFWPIGVLIRLFVAIADWKDSVFDTGKKATARWASTLNKMTYVYRGGHLHLGRLWWFGFELPIPIGIKLLRCFVLIGAPGSNKTVVLGTMAGLWKGGVVAVDPDGQLARTVGKVKNAFRIDPTNPTQSNKFNPFWQIAKDIKRNGVLTASREFSRFGHSVIHTPPESKEPIFPNMARAFVCMAASWMMANRPKDQWTYATLRALMNKGLDAHKFDNNYETAIRYLIEQCAKCNAWGGYTAECAAAIQSAGGNFYGSIVSEAREQTEWMGWPSIQMVSSTSDFDWIDDVKLGGKSVFFNAEISDLQGPLKGWISLCMNSMLSSFESNRARPKHRTLTIIDEAQNQNPTELIQTAPAWVRKKSISLIYALHDLEGAERVFGKNTEGLIGGSDGVMWFDSPHSRNLDYLKTNLGQITRVNKSKGRARYENKEDRDLGTDDQLRRHLSLGNNIIVTRRKGRPMRLKSAPYYSELPVWLYAADPLFKEALLRRIVRMIFGLFTPKSGQHEPETRTHDRYEAPEQKPDNPEAEEVNVHDESSDHIVSIDQYLRRKKPTSEK